MSRLKNAIHYVVSNTEPEKLGSTKLAKILLFADAESFRRTGATITGASYIKRDFGPLVQNFNAAIDELKRESRIAERRGDHFGYPQRQFWATEAPDISEFSGQDIARLAHAKDIICENHTASSISDLSHNLAWQVVPDGEEIPIPAFLAGFRQGQPTADDLAFIQTEFAHA